MINAADALAMILDRVKPLGAITVALRHGLGAALAERIIADEDIPPFDNAAMDGYALQADDTAHPPATLNIIGEIAAGVESTVKQIGQGEAAGIMTGAKIPAGCDAVIQHELTERADGKSVKILNPVATGTNIRKAGADIGKGTTVLTPGRLLRPPDLGVLASLGKQFIQVHRHPSVAILATGNELAPIDRTPGDGRIRNSNSYALQGLIDEQRATAIDLGIARDTPDDLRMKLAEGFRTADMLITTGGVSAGKYDLVIETLNALDVEIVFWKVNIKPGMPLLFGFYDNKKPVFGLPGNPVSSMVTFLQFVRPALRKMSGIEGNEPLRLRAAVLEEIVKNDGKRHFVRGILTVSEGKLTVRTTGSQVSNIMTSLARADCLIIIPEEQRTVHKGEEVEIELL